MELENQNVEVKDTQEVNAQPNQPAESQTGNEPNQDLKGGEQPNPVENNLEEWQKDDRYGKMWKKADDLYSSFKSIEKSYADVNPKYTNLVKILKDNGFKSETLADELKKYADYRDPNSRINQVYNYIDKLMQNDLYSGRIQQFFEQIEQEELQRLYPNMNAEQIKKQQELEQKLQRLEAEEKERKDKAAYQQELDAIQKGFQECEKIANEYGFKITDEVKNFLFTKCGEQNIDPKYLTSEFIKLYGKQLMEARDAKVKENEKQNAEKLKKAQILSGGSGLSAQTPNLSGKAAFTEGLKRIFGGK